VAEVTSRKTTHNVAVFVDNITLLVDTAARHGVDAPQFLFRLKTLSFADSIAIPIVDVTIFVDGVSHQLLDITLDDLADDIPRRSIDIAILGNYSTIEASEWTFCGCVSTSDNFSASDDVAGVVPDLTLTIHLLADHR